MNSEVMPYWTGMEGPKLISFDVRASADYEKLIAQLPAVEDYDQRGFNITVPEDNDIVLINSPLWDRDYISFLNNVGLGPLPGNIRSVGYDSDGETIIARLIKDPELRARTFEGMNAEWFYPYYFPNAAQEFLGDSNLTFMGREGTRDYGDKTLFKDLNEEIGLMTIPGETLHITKDMTEDTLVAEINRMVEEYGDFGVKDKIFMRGDKTTSGISSFPVERGDSVYDVAKEILANNAIGKYLVEPFLDVESSPSLGMRITDEGIHRITPVGTQVLNSDNEHQGNFYPTDVEQYFEDMIVRESLLIANTMMKEGYRGDFGVDWMKTPNGKLYAAEINPRPTGASPLAFLHDLFMRRHGNDVFMISYNLNSDFKDFKSFERHFSPEGEIYDGSEPEGFVPMNFGPMNRYGRCTVAALSRDPEKLADLVLGMTSKPKAHGERPDIKKSLDKMVEARK